MEWDRIQVILLQPFRKDQQLGLSVFRVIYTPEVEVQPQQPNQHFSPKIPDRVANARTSISPSTRLPTTPSTTDIHKHFFGKGGAQKDPTRGVKSRLMKIQSSAEYGSEQEASLSRTAKMVVTAAVNTPRYKLPPGASSPPTTTEKRRTKVVVPFEEEAESFFRSLDVHKIDLENTTFADLRHQLEKRKWRKLTKEEKTVFRSKAEAFVNKIIEDQENAVNSDRKLKPGAQRPKTIDKSALQTGTHVKGSKNSAANSPSSTSATLKTVQKPHTSQSSTTGSFTYQAPKAPVLSEYKAQPSSNNKPPTQTVDQTSPANVGQHVYRVNQARGPAKHTSLGHGYAAAGTVPQKRSVARPTDASITNVSFKAPVTPPECIRGRGPIQDLVKQNAGQAAIVDSVSITKKQLPVKDTNPASSHGRKQRHGQTAATAIRAPDLSVPTRDGSLAKDTSPGHSHGSGRGPGLCPSTAKRPAVTDLTALSQDWSPVKELPMLKKKVKRKRGRALISELRVFLENHSSQSDSQNSSMDEPPAKRRHNGLSPTSVRGRGSIATSTPKTNNTWLSTRTALPTSVPKLSPANVPRTVAVNAAGISPVSIPRPSSGSINCASFAKDTIVRSTSPVSIKIISPDAIMRASIASTTGVTQSGITKTSLDNAVVASRAFTANTIMASPSVARGSGTDAGAIVRPVTTTGSSHEKNGTSMPDAESNTTSLGSTNGAMSPAYQTANQCSMCELRIKDGMMELHMAVCGVIDADCLDSTVLPTTHKPPSPPGISAVSPSGVLCENEVAGGATMPCPICYKSVLVTNIEFHVNICLDAMVL